MGCCSQLQLTHSADARVFFQEVVRPDRGATYPARAIRYRAIPRGPWREKFEGARVAEGEVPASNRLRPRHPARPVRPLLNSLSSACASFQPFTTHGLYGKGSPRAKVGQFAP